MTDRVRTLAVVLDQDYRDDDAESILNAIRMVKGVAHVTAEVVTGSDVMNRMTVTLELRRKVFDAIDAALPLRF